MATQLFVNLPVKDLEKSREFFGKLGFSFNPQFSDEKGACLVLGENIYAMLLTYAFFKTFAKKEIVDAKTATEVLVAIDASSREQVDEIVDAAIAAGGTVYRDPDDHGWMYSRSFEDLDGHIWEVVYMDMSQVPEQP